MSRSALILPAVLGLAILTTGFVSRPPGAVGQAMVPPICDAGGPYSGYLGYPIEFDGTGSTDPDGAIVSYEWDFGDGSSGTGPTPSHNYTVCCDFTVTLTVTDDTQLSSTCTTTVSLAVDNMPPICDAGGPYAGLVGQTIKFDGTGSTGVPPHVLVAYEWDFGDGTTGSGPTPDHAYSKSETFIVTLVVWDDNGATSACTSTASVTPLAVEPTTWGAIKARY